MSTNIIPLPAATDEPQPFDFNGQQVRVVMVDGEPWFMAGEVCAVLGLSNIGQALTGLDDDEKGSITIADGTPGSPIRSIINESGLYSLILRSRKPEAKAFKKWVTGTVLPQIRKTGSYGQAPQLTESEIVHQALQITSRQVEELKAHVAVIEPKANAWERFCSSTGDMSASEAAKALTRAGLSVGGLHKLYAICDAKKEDGGLAWFFRNGHGQREAYQRVVDQGLVRMKSGSYENSKTGEQVTTITPRFTPKALDALAKHLKDAA